MSWSNWTTLQQISFGFVALYATGGPKRQAVGIALHVAHPNISSRGAARFGIHLPRTGYVRAAGINGAGRPVCPAGVGHYMRIGTAEK